MAWHPMRSVLKRLARLRRGPVLARRKGATWLLLPRDWIDNRLYVGQPYEERQLDYAMQCISRYALTSFYDCGANIGVYSVHLAQRFPDLQVMAFEPVPRTYCRLVTNIGLNGLECRIKTHNLGLGERSGRATIAYDATSSGVATLDADSLDNPKRRYNERFEIALSRLDDISRPTGERLYLKIDVEGHEQATLAGMHSLLSENGCVVQIEVWPKNVNAVTAIFEGLEYRLMHSIESDFFFTNLQQQVTAGSEPLLQPQASACKQARQPENN